MYDHGHCFHNWFGWNNGLRKFHTVQLLAAYRNSNSKSFERFCTVYLFLEHFTIAGYSNRHRTGCGYLLRNHNRCERVHSYLVREHHRSGRAHDHGCGSKCDLVQRGK